MQLYDKKSILIDLKKHKSFLDSNIEKYIKTLDAPKEIKNIMVYAVLGGGKRIRPFLLAETAKLYGISSSVYKYPCMAVELAHCFSLVYDDLPCMDNDDYRRGKLSTHKKFNEATAILAGDALHDLAFELITSNLKINNNKSKINLIRYLSQSIGHKGLALGQALDLQFENMKPNKNKILDMYSKKTGKLFEYSFCSPFILANSSNSKIKFAREYGSLFGLIFQIIDDLIDEIGTFKRIGKTPGKDKEQGKSTLLSTIGKNEVVQLCNNEIRNFKNKYKTPLKNNSLLKNLLDYGMSRVN